MTDLFLQVGVVIFSILALLVVRIRSGVWANPVTIMVFCFFAPLFFVLFRWATVQAHQWQYETYIVMWAAIGAWLIFPSLVLCAKGKFQVSSKMTDEWVLRTLEYKLAVRVFGLVVLFSYFLANYVQAGTILPILHPEVAYKVHASFPPIIRFFARASPAAVVLLYMLFWAQRKPIDLMIMALVFFVPITRLSRIDLALGLVALAVMFAFFPIFKVTKKRIVLAAFVLIGLAVGGAELGNLRTTRFGEYDVKYEVAIGWIPEIKGPASVFPIAYGYFPLSFENFDTFVAQFKGEHLLGLYSFDWLFTGFIKLNWISGYAQVQAENAQFVAISTAANVPTALYPFYADFGPIGVVIPMLLYVSIWLFFFYSSLDRFLYLAMFAVYSGGFALSSFQAIIAAPVLVHQLFEIFILFWIVRNVAIRRRDV